MFKILHIADVHLDTIFSGRTETLRLRLRDALREAFDRAVDCAVRENVHALVIAGDLFDNERLSFRTEQHLVAQLRKLEASGISTVYVTGNHDPGGSRFRGAAIPWPSSFHYVSSAEPVVIDVPGPDGEPVGRLVGAGHASASESTNLAASFPRAEGKLPHVGVLHTMVTGAASEGGHDRYAPCALMDLRRPGYRYWALGHIHLRQQVCDESAAHYSGNLQGRNPRETGEKGGLLVSLRDGMAPEVDFRAFGPIQWAELRLDGLESVDKVRDLAARVRHELGANDLQNGNDTQSDAERLLRLVLKGASPLYARLRDKEDVADLEKVLQDELGFLDVEVRPQGLSRPLDLDVYRDQPHVLAEVLALLEEMKRDDEVAEALVPEPLAADPGTNPPDRLAYVRSLLDGLDREAASRLIKSLD